MKIILNGSAEEVVEGITVSSTVATVVEGDPSRGVAVALNGEVVPKTRWPEAVLKDGDRIEILRAIGGG
ncbi:MAG: sulfur carrier protein [Actinomycetota bacterium]|jgi:sulfur carrier protein|nr:sulfur carrier protein [Actinomycetota bacterium]